MQTPKPGPYAKELADAAEFYGNRVIKDFKDRCGSGNGSSLAGLSAARASGMAVCAWDDYGLRSVAMDNLSLRPSQAESFSNLHKSMIAKHYTLWLLQRGCYARCMGAHAQAAVDGCRCVHQAVARDGRRLEPPGKSV